MATDGQGNADRLHRRAQGRHVRRDPRPPLLASPRPSRWTAPPPTRPASTTWRSTRARARATSRRTPARRRCPPPSRWPTPPPSTRRTLTAAYTYTFPTAAPALPALAAGFPMAPVQTAQTLVGIQASRSVRGRVLPGRRLLRVHPRRRHGRPAHGRDRRGLQRLPQQHAGARLAPHRQPLPHLPHAGLGAAGRAPTTPPTRSTSASWSTRSTSARPMRPTRPGSTSGAPPRTSAT